MSRIKAHDPKTAEPSKPKILIYGPPGVGKTWWCLSFPSIIFVDSEGGANLAHYTDRLMKSGGKYLGPADGANDFEVIIDQAKALATEKHKFKTLVIDSITKPFISAVASEAERLGDRNAFGADKKPAVGAMRRLINAVHRLDMNVIFVAHEKTEWGILKNGERGEIGKGPDCIDKLVYELHLCLQVVKQGPQRTAIVKKSRLLGFPEADQFELDYEKFAERYGRDIIQKEAKVIELCSPADFDEMQRLIVLLKVEQDTVDKWLDKANADSLKELNATQAAKVIESLKAKLK